MNRLYSDRLYSGVCADLKALALDVLDVFAAHRDTFRNVHRSRSFSLLCELAMADAIRSDPETLSSAVDIALTLAARTIHDYHGFF